MEVVSGLGDGVFWVGIITLLLDEGVGVRGFAVAALVRLGPRAIISAPAGVLADRVDRRRLLLTLDLARAGVMAALAIAAFHGLGTGGLLAIVLVAYTLAAPYRPALTAALPLIAGERDLSSANALVGTIRQLMTFVGPVCGAVLVRWSSPTVAFSVNAATFVLSAMLMSGVSELRGRPVRSAPQATPDRPAHRARAGWREIAAIPGLGVLTVLVFAMYTARGAELVLYAPVAQARLGLGSSGIGVLTAAVGLGALCALPIASRVAASDRADVMVVLALASTAIPTALLGVTRSAVVACVALVFVGVGVVVFEVVTVMLLQRLARRAVLGRVFGVVGAASNAGKLFGAIAAPAVVLALDLPGAVVMTGIAVGAVGAIGVRGLIRLTGATRRRHEQLRPLTTVLAPLGLFDGASPAVLEHVAGAISTEHLPGGATVLRQGDPADDLFVVRSGDFTVFDHGTVVNRLGPDDWFGEIGLLQHRTRTATVVAMTDAVVWRIPGDTFLSALEDLATEPTGLLEVMAERLRRSAEERGSSAE